MTANGVDTTDPGWMVYTYPEKIKKLTSREQRMPKVFDEAGFTGRFYMADLNEPIHVHVVKDGNEAKYWVSPITLASNSGFSQRDLRRVEELVRKYQSDIATLWRAAEEARRNAGRTS